MCWYQHVLGQFKKKHENRDTFQCSINVTIYCLGSLDGKLGSNIMIKARCIQGLPLHKDWPMCHWVEQLNLVNSVFGANK